MSVQDLAMRKFNNRMEASYPVGSVIVNADCIYEAGKFVMKSLPANLPELFTIRFTAPADFTQGDMIEINGVTMPLRIPAMINASSNLFRAGAVFHIDIDMERQVAFAWYNNYGGCWTGSLPDLSYEEQYAGFHDEDGDTVYTKLVHIPSLAPSSERKPYPHGISGIKKVIDASFRFTHENEWIISNCAWTNTFLSFLIDTENLLLFTSNSSWAKWECHVVIYYTCTDR